MASTYTYAQGIELAQSMCKGIPISTISTISIDMINSMMWKTYPWPWTRATLTPIPLVHNQQDYAVDAADVRYWKLLHARITLTSTSPNQYRDMIILRHLEPLLAANISWPNYRNIAYIPEIAKLRLEAAANVPSGQTYQLDGTYQRRPTKITNSGSLIHFDDMHFQTYVEGVLWMLFRLADDKRQGAAIKTPVGVQYTGQLGVFYDSLMDMIRQEESGQGDTIYPEESIGGTHSTNFPNAFF